MEALAGLTVSPANSSTLVAGAVAGPVLVALKDEVDPETCQLLGGFALAIQSLMGLLVLGSLLLKRARERPRRKWRVWIGDVSKQMVGQAFVHASNVLISDLIARHQADNPCSLYALNIAVDTTFGVLILYAFLKLFTSLLFHYQPSQFRTGDYGSPPSFRIWSKQAAVYVTCLGLMKIVVLGMFWAIPGLFVFANWCLSWLDSDEAQVVAVMLVFPLVMNVLQFLIIDSILKSKEVASPNPDDQNEESRRGFLGPDSDSDDEDDSPSPRRTRDLESSLTFASLSSSTSETHTKAPKAERITVQVLQAASPSSVGTPKEALTKKHSYPPSLSASLDSTSSSTPAPAYTPIEDRLSYPATRVEPIAPLPFVREPGDDSDDEETVASPRSSFGSAWGSGREVGRGSAERVERMERIGEKGEPIRIVPVDVGW